MTKSARKRVFYFPQTMVLLLIIFFMFLVTLSQTKPDYFTVARDTATNMITVSDSPTPTVIVEKKPDPPIRVQNAIDPTLSAKAVIVIDRASGEVLYTKNEDIPLWPASTTKMMTALVSLDEYDKSDIIIVSNPISSGRTMKLIDGENITVDNLLYGLLIHSANDAAYALANYHPEGFDGFVEKMNQKASDLGLINTHFVDPAGFDNEKQYSTASDLASLTLYALENETIAKMVSIPSITISDADYVTFHKLSNVNELLGRVPGVAGVKTGWTENAKENLINLTKRDGNEIITVVLGSDDRFGETQVITDWAFSNYSWDKINPQSTEGQLPELSQ